MPSAASRELHLLDTASKEFARKQLAPGREENDHFPFGPFFQDVVEKAFALDFFHILLPEDLGGVGHNLTALCVVLSNLCQEDSSLGGIVFTQAMAQELLLAAGEREMLGESVAGAKTVEAFLLACPVLCNPQESPLSLKAARAGDGYVLTGKADYVVLGGLAGQALLPAADTDGFAWFLVDSRDPAVTRSEPVLSHGLHACPAVDMTLEKAPARLVGDPGTGEKWFSTVLARMQLAAAAMACGVMKGSLQEALHYSRNRSQGGRKIKDWSEVQMLLANMAIQVEVADLLVTGACRALEKKDVDGTRKAQAAALHILSAAPQVVTDGIQVLGGVGYMKDFGQEKRFRDIGHIQAFLGIFPMKKINLIRQLL